MVQSLWYDGYLHANDRRLEAGGRRGAEAVTERKGRECKVQFYNAAFFRIAILYGVHQNANDCAHSGCVRRTGFVGVRIPVVCSFIFGGAFQSARVAERALKFV
jgi:hypothetical protein